jgi:hypothetical protein
MESDISYSQTAKDFGGGTGYSSSEIRERRKLNAVLKVFRTPQEIAASKLYSELGNYTSENVTKDLRSYLVSQYEKMSQLAHMNMKILAAAIIIDHFNKNITPESFKNTFKIYVQNKFIPISSMDKEEYYYKLKLDIFRYLRAVRFFKS